MRYKYSFFIGRFQPFHIGHLQNIKQALEISDTLIIMIGSSYRYLSINNPFSFEQRKQMIQDDLKSMLFCKNRIIIEPLQDWLYNEYLWKNEVQAIIYKYANLSDNVAMIGHQKDSSSYYLKYFPCFDYVDVDNYRSYSATSFRKKFFLNSIIDKNYIISKSSQHGTHKLIKDFMKTRHFDYLSSQYIKFYCSNECSTFSRNDILLNIMLISGKYIALRKNYDYPGLVFDLPGIIIKHIPFNQVNKKVKLLLSTNILNEINIEKDVIFERFSHAEYCYKNYCCNYLGLIIVDCDFFKKHNINNTFNFKHIRWIKLDKLLKKMSACLLDDHYQIINYISKKHSLAQGT